MIEGGRHRQIQRHRRKCILCYKDDIEDEYHFIIICPFFRDLRLKFIDRYYRIKPSVFEFTKLLTSDHNKTLTNLALFCRYAFSKRNQFMLNYN